MTHIEALQEEASSLIQTATYKTKVQAHSGPYHVQVDADCTVEGEETNTEVLEALRAKARRKIFMGLTPHDFREGLENIQAEDQAKAWAVCVLWFALAPLGRGDWIGLYNEWKGKYRTNTGSVAERDMVLARLGADPAWIDNQIVSRPQLKQNIEAKLKLTINQ